MELHAYLYSPIPSAKDMLDRKHACSCMKREYVPANDWVPLYGAVCGCKVYPGNIFCLSCMVIGSKDYDMYKDRYVDLGHITDEDISHVAMCRSIEKLRQENCSFL
jgi:hypothetical protein